MSANPRVVIAGGGWAGLAAAVELVHHGVDVTLVEAARQLGGRARPVLFDSLTLDNGPHLLIGAYRQLLRLLRTVGASEQALLQRLPLELLLRSGTEKIALRAPNLPAPAHLAVALLRAEGLTFSERRAALGFAFSLVRSSFALPRDTSVDELLVAHGQTPRLVKWLWAPLCLATLNVNPHEASARVFLRVLRDAFANRTRDSDLLLPRVDLGRLFPQPARDYLGRHGATVRLGARVKEVRIDRGRLTGVALDQETLAATHLILALPASAAGTLLGEHKATEELAARLRRMEHTPIASVYLRYPPGIALERPMVGLTGTLSQWVFDRALSAQPGVIAAVMSGTGEPMQMEREALAARVAQELSAHFGFPAPETTFVIRERRAAFRCGVDIDAARPEALTPINGLLLAGDYTDTGYPATLEGAVRSGVKCAHMILADLGRTPNGISS